MKWSSFRGAKLVASSCVCCLFVLVNGIGVNWGLQASHLLPPNTVVQMLKDNGFQSLKLFDAENYAMSALANSGIQVMVGIPNDMLFDLAGSDKKAEQYVSKNISNYIKDGVDIRYVAVGNEPFLKTWNGSYLNTTFPAMRRIQSALSSAGLSSRVKVTVPLNADVYQSETGKPSGGDFRPEIHDLMLSIIAFLSQNSAPVTVNIYPFLSLYDDPNFPLDYAFFDGSSASITDGALTYTNVFDANHDTLVAALQRNGYGDLPIVVGEIGWPTDGDMNANPEYAQKFNQGFINHVSSGNGTPLRPGPVTAYLFSLIDEDEKSIQPGNFERHWGVFAYDGSVKYAVSVGNESIVGAKGVKYLERKWCVLKNSAGIGEQRVGDSVSYACGNADCSSLGYKTSCGELDTRGNVSYAFNSYYQRNDQDEQACGFAGLATVTEVDPSNGTCRFGVMIQGFSCGSLVELRGVLVVCFFSVLMVILLLLLVV